MDDEVKERETALTRFTVLPLNAETAGRFHVPVSADSWSVGDLGDLYFWVGTEKDRRRVACFARGTWLSVIEN